MANLDQPRWKFVVTALDGTMPAGSGEVYYPSERTYADPLGGVRQASFTIPTDHPRANFIMNNDVLCKVYRHSALTNTWKLMLVGDVVQSEEEGTGSINKILITVADPFWRLIRRLIGLNMGAHGQAAGYGKGNEDVVDSHGNPNPVLFDLSTIVQDIVDEANSAY